MAKQTIWCVIKNEAGTIIKLRIKFDGGSYADYTPEDLARLWDEKGWRFEVSLPDKKPAEVARRERNGSYYFCTLPDETPLNNLSEIECREDS